MRTCSLSRSAGLTCHSVPLPFEVLDEHRRGEASVDLVLGVDAVAGALDHLARNIRRPECDVPVRDARVPIVQEHQDAIWFLSAGARRAPQVEPPDVCAPVDQVRQDVVLERLEEPLVTEEARLVRRHRLDDELVGIVPPGRAQVLHQAGDRSVAEATEDAVEPRLDEVLLAVVDHDRGALADELAHVVVVGLADSFVLHGGALVSALPRRRGG